MPKVTIVITNPTGLHTRPGTEFVRLAKGFSSTVTIRKGDKSANAKSLVKLLQIGVSQGDSITLECDGDDGVDALEKLQQFIQNLTD